MGSGEPQNRFDPPKSFELLAWFFLVAKFSLKFQLNNEFLLYNAVTFLGLRRGIILEGAIFDPVHPWRFNFGLFVFLNSWLITP